MSESSSSVLSQGRLGYSGSLVLLYEFGITLSISVKTARLCYFYGCFAVVFLACRLPSISFPWVPARSCRENRARPGLESESWLLRECPDHTGPCEGGPRGHVCLSTITLVGALPAWPLARPWLEAAHPAKRR